MKTPNTNRFVASVLVIIAIGISSVLLIANSQESKPEPKKDNFKTFMMNTEIYNAGIRVVITDDTLRAANFVRAHFNDSTISSTWFIKARGVTLFDRKGTQPPIMWMPSVPDTPSKKGTAAHEIFHLVYILMDYRGIPLSDISNEAYAYLIGYLTKQFYENIKINQENE